MILYNDYRHPVLMKVDFVSLNYFLVCRGQRLRLVFNMFAAILAWILGELLWLEWCIPCWEYSYIANLMIFCISSSSSTPPTIMLTWIKEVVILHLPSKLIIFVLFVPLKELMIPHSEILSQSKSMSKVKRTWSDSILLCHQDKLI